MSFKEFCSKVETDLREMLPYVSEIVLGEAQKNNGVSRSYISLRMKDNNVVPMIYLESFYEQWRRGRSYENILYDIAHTYEENQYLGEFRPEDCLKWEYVQDKVIRHLVNYESNKEMLAKVPYRKVEDLAVIYHIYVGDILERGYAFDYG